MLSWCLFNLSRVLALAPIGYLGMVLWSCKVPHMTHTVPRWTVSHTLTCEPLALLCDAHLEDALMEMGIRTRIQLENQQIQSEIRTLDTVHILHDKCTCELA